jgi:predicted Rossmann fold nucleotide-binding protein DprA/Smf involved in DNA uptake
MRATDAVGPVSDDARAILLLCSSIAAGRGDAARGDDARPLGPARWARLAVQLDRAAVTPRALLGLDVDALRQLLGDALPSAAVVARQLARTGQLAIELDRLAMRGINVLTLADEAYPWRLRDRLGPKAPPVLFLAGERSLLDGGGVAIVGSRDVDAAGEPFAAEVAASAARTGRAVVSGGARGVDQIAMRAALQAGGTVIGLLPEGIEHRIREPETRKALADGLALVASPYHPGAGFTAGAALGRNKLIYALADVAVIVSSAAGTGGTWAGAEEALKAGWVPVFVRDGDDVPAGNRALVRAGARPLSAPIAPDPEALPSPAPPPSSSAQITLGLADDT